MTPASGGGGGGGGAGSPPRELYTIPASSGWFRWDEIHDTERAELPEFFSSGGGGYSRNPRVYREYRDFIINKYREDPSRRLTFTEVRKALVGDVGLLRKVFVFLDKWGLINFSAPAAAEPAGSGVVVVVEDALPAGLQVVPPPPPPPVVARTGDGGENEFHLPPLTSYKDVFAEWKPTKAMQCDVCKKEEIFELNRSTEDSSRVCSRCAENARVKGGDVAESLNNQIDDVANDTCTKVGANGKEGNTIESSVHLKDNASNLASNPWTESELLLLLEGVAKHGDDWDRIANYVQTKNKSECISKLIQLPFGEHLLGSINGRYDFKMLPNQTPVINKSQQTPAQSNEMAEAPLADKNEDSLENSTQQRPLKRRQIISSIEAAESLMNQVALLSKAVCPHVAAAAADAATAMLSREDGINFNEKGISDNKLNREDQDRRAHQQNGSSTKLKSLKASHINRLRATTATAIGAAAARAKLLADQEQREIELLMASIIETELRKLRYKMKHLEELESVMEQEYAMVQQEKVAIVGEWLSVLQQLFRSGIPRLKDQTMTNKNPGETAL